MGSNKLSNEGVSFAGRCLNSFAVLMASISAFLIMPQIANADPSQGHYPILTVADIEVCRPKLSDFQSDWLQHLRVNLDNNLPGGSFPDAASASRWKGMLDKDAIDPVLFYAQGLDNGEALIGGLDGINEYGEFREEAYRNILKGLDGMGGPRLSNSANFDVEYNDFKYENYYAAETCIAQVWTAKYNAMHPDTAVASNTAPTSQSVGSYASGGGYAPGGVSVSVSEPDRTGENTVASPKIVEPTLPAKPAMGTGGSALPSQQKTGDYTPVSDCVSIEQSSHHPFTNKCGFKVTYTYCVLSPKKDAWSEAFKCEDQKFGTDAIGANNINGAQNGGGVTTYWFACRYPQLPIAKYERGRGAVGVCK